MIFFFFGFQGDGNFTLEAANQLYVAEKYQLTDEFKQNLNDNYGASGQNVDFAVDASRTKINDWVEEFTQHKIKDLLPEGCIFIKKIISNTFIYLFMYQYLSYSTVIYIF